MTIEDYRFGRIRIDGTEYTSDVIIHPDRIDDEWWRDEGHRLAIDDLSEVLAEPPDALVIGTGKFGRMKVPEGTLEELRAARIDVKVARTGKAVQLFNNLEGGQNRVAAALHLTC